MSRREQGCPANAARPLRPTFLPLAGSVALGIGADPLLLTIPVELAATRAFMLPIAAWVFSIAS